MVPVCMYICSVDVWIVNACILLNLATQPWLCIHIHISCATLSIRAKIGTCLAMELTNVVAQLVEVIV